MTTTNRHPTESDIPMHGWRPYSDMHRERVRAHLKHGDGSMEAKRWDSVKLLPILLEEVGEVANAINERNLQNLTYREYKEQLRSELVQVGAMAAAWIDAIDAEKVKPDES